MNDWSETTRPARMRQRPELHKTEIKNKTETKTKNMVSRRHRSRDLNIPEYQLLDTVWTNAYSFNIAYACWRDFNTHYTITGN